MQEGAREMFPNYFQQAYAHLSHHKNSYHSKYSNLVNTIKCNCTTFGQHISMERQRGSFPMSQSTMMIMIGISQCAAIILLCIVVTFCTLHTFARFDGVGTWQQDLFWPKLCTIILHCGAFQSPPQLCILWAYQVTIQLPIYLSYAVIM